MACYSTLHLTLEPLRIDLLLLRCLTLLHLRLLLSKPPLICHLSLLLGNKNGLIIVNLLLNHVSLSHLLCTL